eukprot:g1346.t1
MSPGWVFLAALLAVSLLAMDPARADNTQHVTCSPACEQSFVRGCMMEKVAPRYDACRSRLDAGNLTNCIEPKCADTPWMNYASIAHPGFATQCSQECEASFIRVCLNVTAENASSYLGYDECRRRIDTDLVTSAAQLATDNALKGCFAGCNDTAAMRISKRLACSAEVTNANDDPFHQDACTIVERATISTVTKMEWSYVFNRAIEQNCFPQTQDFAREATAPTFTDATHGWRPTSALEGRYQDLPGQTTCKRCKPGDVPTLDRTTCVIDVRWVIPFLAGLVFLCGFLAWRIYRRAKYSQKYTVVKFGKQRCCARRSRLDFPRRSRFSRRDVAEGAKLGNGAFGEVNQGTLQVGKATLRIAVKHVLESKATDAQREDTIVECRLQCEFESPFLVKCFGFATGPGAGDFSILLELMDIGDLPRYMESVVDGGGRIPEATRLRWMIEIASALEYMHASNLIHADLAARNLCLYHSKTGVSCKVTDFGLSHSIDPKDRTYMLPFGGSVPFHWTAPECLPCDANFADIYSSSGGSGGSRSSANTVLRLTTANDVWAFGVTLWEIEGLAANGKLNEPFEGVLHKDLYDSLSTKKAKLEFKFRCHDKTIDTFSKPADIATESCLRVRPWARATMADIRRRFQAATLCDAVSWEQDDVHKWLDRMGAPRVDDADLWDIDSYELLMSEILNDVNRPDYMAELKESMDNDELFALSGRLQGELAGLVELVTFLDGDTCPKGYLTGHPDRFAWLTKRDNAGAKKLRTKSGGSGSSSTRPSSPSIYDPARADNTHHATCSPACEQSFVRGCMMEKVAPRYDACRSRLDAGNLTNCIEPKCADTPWMNYASIAHPGFATQCSQECEASFIRVCLNVTAESASSYLGYDECRRRIDTDLVTPAAQLATDNALKGCFAGCNDTAAMRISKRLACSAEATNANDDVFHQDACTVVERATISTVTKMEWSYVFNRACICHTEASQGTDLKIFQIRLAGDHQGNKCWVCDRSHKQMTGNEAYGIGKTTYEELLRASYYVMDARKLLQTDVLREELALNLVKAIDGSAFLQQENASNLAMQSYYGDCIRCYKGKAGEDGNTAQSSEAASCRDCDAGRYQDQQGEITCKACPAGQFQPVFANDYVESLISVRAGEHGGSCTCPDGQVYWVGDEGNDCRSLACFNGGTPGECHLYAGNWSYNSVTNIEEGAKLGNGAFGEVNQGTMQVGKASVRIAVKHVLAAKATDAQRKDTIVECRLQCELESPFVVKCFGFATGPGPDDFSILLELMDLGDLPSY